MPVSSGRSMSSHASSWVPITRWIITKRLTFPVLLPQGEALLKIWFYNRNNIYIQKQISQTRSVQKQLGECNGMKQSFKNTADAIQDHILCQCHFLYHLTIILFWASWNIDIDCMILLLTYFWDVFLCRWLGVNLEFLGNGIVLAASILSVMGKGTLSPGMVGLAVSHSLQVWIISNVSMQNPTLLI